MLGKLALSIAVGILTWVVVAAIAMLLGRFLDAQMGSFVGGIAVLLGVVAAIWYYFTGRTLNV